MKDQCSRRDFLRKGAGTAALLISPSLLVNAVAGKKRTATDRVLLGKSGLLVSRLGMGTGSQGGRIQRELGQEGFTKLIRYGIDQGLTFIDTAENYKNIHAMLKQALQGVARDRIQIQSKLSAAKGADLFTQLQQMLADLGTDYLDSFLIHCVTTADWPQQCGRMMEDLEKAKAKGLIRSHGVSIHGLAPLKAAASVPWIDIALVRVNHNGHHMDGSTAKFAEPGDHKAAMPLIRQLAKNKMGLVAMKLVGNGDFVSEEDREAAIRFVMKEKRLHAAVMGFKSTQEIDEAIARINSALGAA